MASRLHPYRSQGVRPIPGGGSGMIFRECQFILDDDVLETRRAGRDVTYCGKPVKPGTPYCEEHCARCYEPIDREPKKKRGEAFAGVQSWAKRRNFYDDD